ncbi:hypothetical protein XENTR_v10009151 [Xenopus tropicalis]|nr:hypothetical protein XENTR_v10009151 [Xenopus tropicalis]
MRPCILSSCFARRDRLSNTISARRETHTCSHTAPCILGVFFGADAVLYPQILLRQEGPIVTYYIGV